jgi:hypothetical protein
MRQSGQSRSMSWWFATSMAIVLVGCAATVVRSGRTATSYEKLFEAARQEAVERNFGITSADINSGLINGQQGVLFGRGNQVFVHIKVTKGSPNLVEVSVVPPPGTVGNVDGIVRGIFEAIQKRNPDFMPLN